MISTTIQIVASMSAVLGLFWVMDIWAGGGSNNRSH